MVDDRGMGKSLLRAALRRLIPDSVIDRREKVAFAVPLLNWLTRSEAVHGALQRAAALPFLDARELGRLQAGPAGDLTAPRVFALWRVFGLIEWMEAFDVQVS